MQFTTRMVEAIVAETGIGLYTSISMLRDDLNQAVIGFDIAAVRPFAPQAHVKKIARLRSLARELATELGAEWRPNSMQDPLTDFKTIALLETAASLKLRQIRKVGERTAPGRKGKDRREDLDQLYQRIQNWSGRQLIYALCTLDVIASTAAKRRARTAITAPLEWLVGYRLPAVFKANFGRQFGRSNLSSRPDANDDSTRIGPRVGGPGIRFAQACLASLDIPMQADAVEKHWDRSRERRRGTSQVKN